MNHQPGIAAQAQSRHPKTKWAAGLQAGTAPHQMAAAIAAPLLAAIPRSEPASKKSLGETPSTEQP